MADQRLIELISPGTHGCHFKIPEPLVKTLRANGNNRVICTINGHYLLHAALSKKDKSTTIIYISKRVQKDAGILSAKQISAVIEIDRTKYQASMPVELQEVMDTDYEALKFFEKLSMGKKRSLLFYVASAKNADTRINRSLKIAENLKMGAKTPRDLIK